MKRPTASFLVISSLVLGLLSGAACVTVNVNFPEGAVQQATDDFVRDLYRAREKSTKPSTAPTPKQSFWDGLTLIPEAHAELALSIKTPAALGLRDKMAARLKDILVHKGSGALGEGKDGMLVVKDEAKINARQLAFVKKLVSEENADRQALYAEFTRSNTINGKQPPNVAQSFARSFQSESPSNTWIQDEAGAWSQKP